MRALVIRTTTVAILMTACGPSSADPAFESTTLSEVVGVRGGDCAEHRCVSVVAPVVGSREGEGSCAIYGPGDPDTLAPLAQSGPLEMIPGEDTVWRDVELPDDAPPTDDLNEVCTPMIEG